jgi:hypothetical protein
MTNVSSIQDLLNDRVLRIPDYQRGYAWEKQQWDELLEDLEFLADGKDHYTGSLVLHPQPTVVIQKGGAKVNVFHIVDGQQRMTTIVLLLDAIREALASSDPDAAEGILNRYIRFPDKNHQDTYRLQLNSDCHDYFVHNVLGSTPGPQGATIASHQRLSEAREHFAKYLKEKAKALGSAFQAWLLDLREKITQRLKIGEYQVGDTTEVGVIFEVMNNRGKQLSELEKVKNYLLYVASKLALTGHDLAIQINDAWSSVFQQLMSAGLASTESEDRLLYNHWLMAYDPDRRNWDGSKCVKSRFHLRIPSADHPKLLEEVRKYVRTLQNSVLAFAEVLRPELTNAFAAYPPNRVQEIRDWAARLARIGALSIFLPALMAIRLRFPKDADAYITALRLFETYAFRVFRWAEKRANAGQTRLLRLGYEIYHGQTTVNALSKEVRQKTLYYCPDSEFRDGFEPSETNNFYHWGGIRYFLYEYEMALARGTGVKIKWEDLEKYPQRSIEHILPQTPVDKYWTDRFDEATRRIHTHHVGNLSLTLDNSSYSNKPYPDKAGNASSPNFCYATAPLFMERKIAADFADWDLNSLKKRAKTLKKWALERWRVDASDLTGAPTAEDEDEGDIEQI